MTNMHPALGNFRPPHLSVVVPAYNEEQRIGHCLKVLTTQQTQRPFEIIVVDNGSKDKTAEIAKNYKVTVCKEKKKGYGEAARTGVRLAKAPIIALTDADTIPNPHWIDHILDAYDRDPSMVALGGPFEYYDGPMFLRTIVRTANALYPRLCTPSLCGMNMSFRKIAYTAVGGYAKGVNLQADSNLGLRLMKYGRVGFLPKNIVRSSARRHATLKRFIVESSIRTINFIMFLLTGRPVFRAQTDIR